jgi:adhesin transport system outer membrane protein
LKAINLMAKKMIFVFRKLCLGLLFLVCNGCFAEDRFKSTLHQLIEVYPPVVAARSQLQSANAELDSANWNFYPTPSLAIERSDKKVIGALNQDTRLFRLQQPLWTGGRLSAQVKRAEALQKQASSALQEQRLATAFRWLQLWAEYQGATRKITAYKDAEEKHLEYAQRIERRTQEGFSATSDLELSQSRLASVRSELRQYMASQMQARNRLEQMLGSPLTDARLLQSEAGQVVKTFPAFELKSLHQELNLEEVIDKHPLIQKFLMTTEVAQADVAMTKSRNVPEIYLRGEMRTGNQTGTDRILYLGLNSNFGPGLSTISAVTAALSKLDAARNDVSAKRMEIKEVIQADLQTYDSQIERIDQLEKTFRSNNNYLQSSERQFLAGRRSWQEVMNTAREDAQIVVQIAEAQTQIWLAQQRLRILKDGLDVYLSSAIAANTSR